MEYIDEDTKLVILPDSSSNDYEYHKELKNRGVNIIVLDHHEADHISEDAIIINNQLSDYPNKQMSGVGVV
jgi:single-stranded-DNA-specific exonuclease